MSWLPALLILAVLALQAKPKHCLDGILRKGGDTSWIAVERDLGVKSLETRSSSEERRTDVMRAVLSGPAEPGFWPSRGRRGGADGVISQEQQTAPPFWAHRGREEMPQPPCAATIPEAGFYAQEPKFLLIHRRESENAEPFWISRGRKRSEQ